MSKYNHFLMTDRAVNEGHLSNTGSAFGPMRFGVMPAPGDITALWGQDFHCTYDTCLTAHKRELGGYARLFRELYDEMVESGKEILFFIHGYKHSFDQLKKTVGVLERNYVSKPGSNIGHIVAFSWATSPKTQDYDLDLEAANTAGKDFCAFLLELKAFLEQAFDNEEDARAFADKLNLVTISMGCRVLEKAVECFFSQSDHEPFQAFNEVILAAPDLDFTVFDGEMMPRIAELARRTHCHFNTVDFILYVSQWKNRKLRLGRSGPPRKDIHPSIIFVDTTKVVPFASFEFELSFEMNYPVTHNYFLRQQTVIEDANYIFRHEEAHVIPGRELSSDQMYKLLK
ncbi:MAG: alpha/beta hydrolase [Cyanobacteria bacterium TGS_CYA1]|nr:alpha/beta hydrolase [Cyanobacteria bacterium TGS_CYA1]